MVIGTRYIRLAKEGSWIVVGQIVTVAGALVLVRVLTEYLDPEQYGQLALGLTIAGLVNQVVMGGIIAGIGRYYSIAAEKNDLPGFLAASEGVMGYATLAVGVIALLLIIGLVSTGQERWLALTVALLGFSVLSAYNSALSGIQNAARQRPIVALHSGVDAWLKIGLAVGIMVWLGTSSTAVVIGYACSTSLTIASQFVFLRRLIQSQNKSSNADNNWKCMIWAFSWPMMVGGLFNWGYYASQRWALELFTTTDEVGHFYALTQIAYTPISMAAAMFMSFLTPILFSKVGAATDHDRIRSTHRVVTRVAWLGLGFTLLAASIAFFMHDLIFRLLVASEYRKLSLYMPYIIMAAGILAMSQALALIVAVENQTRRFLPLAIIGNGGVAALNLYLTYLWGMEGLIGSMVVGAIAHCVWMLKLVFSNINRVKLRGA